MNDLNMELLKQHTALLRTYLDGVNRVANSIEQDAKLLEPEGAQDPEADELAQARAEAAALSAKLAQAVEDLHFVMAGGDPCKVCTVKCLMGPGDCNPRWRGEEAVE